MATPMEWMAPDDAEPMPVDDEEEVLSFPAGLKSTPCIAIQRSAIFSC